MTVEVIRARAFDGISHGFLGRKGGVSTGIYSGLNVGIGSDDDRATVLENRRLATSAVLPGAQLARVYQIHSADVVTITQANEQGDPQKGDAMVTKTPGILLGIVTADCVPVLFADREAGVIGAAHAGWKGAISGVTDNTIAAMEALGADRARIVCAIGPCIAQKSYEVDAGFFKRFAEDDPMNERFFSDGKPGHYQFDIEGYVAARLASAGIGKVECLGEDTYSQPDRFFSYRRSCHLGEPGYGRQISLIGLRA
ncbi:MAG: peptidoglycan editing factor PgeF [Sphingorhabdus sp.]